MSLSAETKKKIASAFPPPAYWVNLKRQLTASETTELICNQRTDVEIKLIKAAAEFYDSLRECPYEYVASGDVPLDCLDLWSQFLEAAAEHQNR